MGELFDEFTDTVHRAKGAYGVKAHKGFLSRAAGDAPVTLHHYDDMTDETTIETFQNVNPIAEQAKAMRLSGNDGYTPSRDLKHVAMLPLVVINDLYRKGINVMSNADWPKVASFLDDPENSAWRTSTGKISKRAWRKHFTRQGSRG